MPSAAKKVLIIEDEVDLVNNLAFALSDYCQVIAAATGREGLKKAQKEKPDLILLDLLLPDRNGLEILQELKKNEKTDDIPVIVLTNLGDKETISKIVQAGGKEYLVKADWSISDIVKKIQDSL